MEHDTLLAYLDQWAEEKSDEIWLRDFKGEGSDDYSWRESAPDSCSCISARATVRQGHQNSLLSRNRAHWFFADLAIMAAGNVSVGLFTTLNADVAQYIAEFTESKAIFVGEAENWDRVKEVLADDVTVISLPGVDIPEATLTWDQLLSEGEGKSPSHVPKHDDMIALIFTSGTTGRPKGSFRPTIATLSLFDVAVSSSPLRRTPFTFPIYLFRTSLSGRSLNLPRYATVRPLVSMKDWSF